MMNSAKRVRVDSDEEDCSSSNGDVESDADLNDSDESSNNLDSSDEEEDYEEGSDSNSDEISDAAEEDDDDDDDVDDDEDVNQDDEDDASEYEEMEVDFEHEIKTGNGIIAQSRLYNGLLSCRMKAQEALTAMNQLPQGDDFKCMSSSGSKFEEAAKDAQCIIKKTLWNLLKLQDELLSCRNDTSFISAAKLQSDSEKIETAADSDDVTSVNRLQMEKCHEFLSNRQSLLNKFRDETLEAVENGVTASSVRNSFENFESSAVSQIKQVLLDKDRLVRRTQLIRSSLPIIGKKENQEVDEKSMRQKYDCEIFDDSDFYNKLLTQHISLKTSNLMDMTAVSKEWAELGKLKKNAISVDRKASKGRKLRYTVHRKLINFMTPVHIETLYSDEQRDALAREVFRGQS